MVGWSPRFYILSFVKIGPPVQEKTIFEGFFFTLYGRGGHLGHVTQMPRTNFRSPYTRRLHINLALIGQVVFEKKMFENVDGRKRTTDAGP